MVNLMFLGRDQLRLPNRTRKEKFYF